MMPTVLLKVREGGSTNTKRPLKSTDEKERTKIKTQKQFPLKILDFRQSAEFTEATS